MVPRPAIGSASELPRTASLTASAEEPYVCVVRAPHTSFDVLKLRVVAGSVFAITVSAFGAWLGSGRNVSIISPTLGFIVCAILAATVMGLVSVRWQEEAQHKDTWTTSIRQFEECLFVFGYFFKESQVDWEDNARLCRYPPRLSAAPVKDWTKNGGPSLLTADEQVALRNARAIYAPDNRQGIHIWNSDFHQKRKRMTDIVEQWVEWDGLPGFRSFIRETIRLRRNMLVQLAYLEIAIADELPSKVNMASEWSMLGDKWKCFFSRAEVTAQETVQP